MRNLKNRKGLSPIFAVLILIAIAVIAGIVVYMFTSGTIANMTGGGTAGQEKVAVEAIVTNSATSIVAHAKSTAGTNVDIDGLILKDSGGATIDVVPITAVQLPKVGTLTPVPVTLTASMTLGDIYTVTLTSANGGAFVSSSFTASWVVP